MARSGRYSSAGIGSKQEPPVMSDHQKMGGAEERKAENEQKNGEDDQKSMGRRPKEKGGTAKGEGVTKGSESVAPEVKAELDRLLEPLNFDPEGWQKKGSAEKK